MGGYLEEEVLQVLNTGIITASGFKKPFGDRNFVKGQKVYTWGDRAFGWDKKGGNAPYVPVENLGMLIMSYDGTIISIYGYDDLSKLGEFNLAGYTLLGYANSKTNHYLLTSKDSKVYCINLLSGMVDYTLDIYSLLGAYCSGGGLYLLSQQYDIWDISGMRYIQDNYQVGLPRLILYENSQVKAQTDDQKVKDYILNKINATVAEFQQDCPSKSYSLLQDEFYYMYDVTTYREGDVLSDSDYNHANRKCYRCMVAKTELPPGDNPAWEYIGIEGDITTLTHAISSVDPVVMLSGSSQGIAHMDRDLKFFGMYSLYVSADDSFDIIVGGQAVATNTAISNTYAYLYYMCNDKIVNITDSRLIIMEKYDAPDGEIHSKTDSRIYSNTPHYFVYNGYVYGYKIRYPAYRGCNNYLYSQNDNNTIRNGDSTLIAELTEDASQYDFDNNNIYNLSSKRTVNRSDLNVVKGFDTGGTLLNYRLCKANEPKKAAKKIVAAMSK